MLWYAVGRRTTALTMHVAGDAIVGLDCELYISYYDNNIELAKMTFVDFFILSGFHSLSALTLRSNLSF